MRGEHVLSHIARVQHCNAHQALGDELGLEEVLAVFSEALLTGRAAFTSLRAKETPADLRKPSPSARAD